jgi:hypothetical protein
MPIREKREHTACQVGSLASKARSPGLLPARSRGILRIRSLSSILILATVTVHLGVHLFGMFGSIRRVAIVVCGRLGAVLGFHVHFVMYSPATGGGSESRYHALEDTDGFYKLGQSLGGLF